MQPIVTWLVFRENGQGNLEPQGEYEAALDNPEAAIKEAAKAGKRGGSYVAIEAANLVRKKVSAKRVMHVDIEDEQE